MQILTLNRTVGRNFDAGEIINVAKLGFFSHCGTGHTCQFGIKAEIVLESDGSQGLVFRLNTHPFLRFNGLMQAIGLTPAFHHTAGKLINDDNLVVFDNIVNIANVHLMSTQRLVYVMNQTDVADIVQTALFNQADFF